MLQHNYHKLTLTLRKYQVNGFLGPPPCFPVLSVEFRHVDAYIDGTQEQILISRNSGHVTCPVDICCTSYCEIVVDGKQHRVFWEWTPYGSESVRNVTQTHTTSPDEGLQNDSDDDFDDSDDGDDNEDPTHHTLPFKVLGVAYSAERQKHLENAFIILRERLVKAKIVPEIDNAYDKNAIAVMLDYGHGWVKIGYIAKELTQFLHPLLKCDHITSVSLKHINFRTSYLRAGFYATVQITRKGQWENTIIKASKRVM